jgi:hypothetical protein
MPSFGSFGQDSNFPRFVAEPRPDSGPPELGVSRPRPSRKIKMKNRPRPIIQAYYLRILEPSLGSFRPTYDFSGISEIPDFGKKKNTLPDLENFSNFFCDLYVLFLDSMQNFRFFRGV